MTHFFVELKSRNEILFYFGLFNGVLAVLLFIFSFQSSIKVYNINALYKPIKFALSTCIYSCSMVWYCAYLKNFNHTLFTWAIIILLGFEVTYILSQALRGQLSHYNLSTPLYSFLYSMMALAATLVTIYTAYVALLFFSNDVFKLPNYYLWGIRFGLIIFVIFSFEGFVMGSKLTHTIGGNDGGVGIPFLNWSYYFGDPRVAHFIGMHSLQVIPILSFYIFKNTKLTALIAIMYFLYALFTLNQALKGKPFISLQKNPKHDIIK